MAPVVDAATPGRFCSEVEAAAYAEGDHAALGSRIDGHNVRGEFRRSTRSTVTEFDVPRRFTWATGAVEDPVATWTFLLEPSGDGTRLTHEVTLHAGRPPLSSAIERDPDRAGEIVAARLDVSRQNMFDTVEGIARSS